MKYGIVIYPPREVQDRANALRMRYDLHYALIPPHITVKEPFEINEKEELEAIIEAIDNVAKEIPPFQMTINKVSTFLPTSPVVYFAFEESQMIQNLNEQLNSGTLYRQPSYSYIPHMTIAQNLAKDELHDIHNRLRLHDFKMEFPVDRIHLLYQIENQTWASYQTFLLQGKK